MRRHCFAIYRGGIKQLDHPVKTYSMDQAGAFYAQKVLSPPQPYWGKLEYELQFVDLGSDHKTAMEKFEQLPRRFSDIPEDNESQKIEEKPQEEEKPEVEAVVQAEVQMEIDLGV